MVQKFVGGKGAEKNAVFLFLLREEEGLDKNDVVQFIFKGKGLDEKGRGPVFVYGEKVAGQQMQRSSFIKRGGETGHGPVSFEGKGLDEKGPGPVVLGGRGLDKKCNGPVSFRGGEEGPD